MKAPFALYRPVNDLPIPKRDVSPNKSERQSAESYLESIIPTPVLLPNCICYSEDSESNPHVIELKMLRLKIYTNKFGHRLRNNYCLTLTCQKHRRKAFLTMTEGAESLCSSLYFLIKSGLFARAIFRNTAESSLASVHTEFCCFGIIQACLDVSCEHFCDNFANRIRCSHVPCQVEIISLPNILYSLTYDQFASSKS